MFKVTVKKWLKSDKYGSSTPQPLWKLYIYSQSEARKHRREAEEWLGALRYIVTSDSIEGFREEYGSVAVPPTLDAQEARLRAG